MPARCRQHAGQIQTPDGGTEIRIREDMKAPWKSWIKVGPDEILDFLDFAADGKSAFLKSSIGADTARVMEKNIVTGVVKVAGR